MGQLKLVSTLNVKGAIMKPFKILISVALLSLPAYASAEIVLDTIEVEASAEATLQADVKSDAAYAGDTVFQKEGYLKGAPMQKQISGKRALQVAGSNGDPVKALKTFAGVVSSNNDSSAEIYIHGSKPRETRFSLNHFPVGYLFHLGGIHSVIAPEIVDQIDAYLGGFDVTYGGAMGGIVDITPKYPTGSGEGRVHIGLYDADFAYDAKLGKNTSLFIGGRRSYLDLIADKLLDKFSEDEDDKRKHTEVTLYPQFYDGQMILSHQKGDNIFSLEAVMAQDQLKINDTFNVEKDPVAIGKVDVKQLSNTVGARWVHLGDRISSNTLFYRLYSKQDASFFNADYFVDTEVVEYGLYHETVKEYDKHKVTLGGEFVNLQAPTKVKSNAPATNDFGDLTTGAEVISLDKTFKANELSLFAQDIWDITPSNHLRFGLRAWKADFQKLGSGVDPRVAFVHDFSDDFSAAFSVGMYSQRPSTLTMIKDFGNPKIKTYERSNHYTFSLQKTLSENSSITVEPYYKTFKNLAIDDDLTNYEAIGKGKAYGADITYKKNISNVDIMVAYTYVNAKRQLNSKAKKQYSFEGDIPHTLQIGANYRFGKNWRLSANAKSASGSPYTPIVATEPYTYEGKQYVKPIYGKPYSKRLDANFDLDIQLGKTLKYRNKKSLEIYAELMNVNALFKPNIAGLKFNDKYQEDGTYKQIGFLPSLHMNYKF